MADTNNTGPNPHVLGVQATINGQEIAEGAKQFITKLGEMERAADKAANAMTDAFQFLNEQLKGLADSASKNREALDEIVKALNMARKSPTANQDIVGMAEKEYDKAEKMQQAVEEQIDNTRESIIQQAKAFENAAGEANAAGNAGANAASNISSSMSDATKQTEALTTIMKKDLRAELKELETRSAALKQSLMNGDNGSIQTQIDRLRKQRSEWANSASPNASINVSVIDSQLEKLYRRRDALVMKEEQEEAELKKVEARIKEINTQMGQTDGKAASFRQKITALTNELHAMESANKQDTDEYRRKSDELAKLKKQQYELNRQMTILSTPGTGMAAFREGVTGISGALTAGMGIMSMFNARSEEMEKIQTRLQSVMSITMGIQQLMSLSYQTSTLRVYALAKANAILKASTASLGAAMLGVVSVMGALVITGLVVAWKQFSREIELARVRINTYKDVAKKAVDENAKQLSSLDNLVAKYNKLGSTIQDKNKFLRENQNAFNELGVAIKSVNEMDALFASEERLEMFRKAIKERARATAAMSVVSDAYRKKLEMDIEKDTLGATFKEGDIIARGQNGTSITGAVSTVWGKMTAEEAEAKNKEMAEQYEKRHEYEYKLIDKQIEAAMSISTEAEKNAQELISKAGLTTTNDEAYKNAMSDLATLMDKNARDFARKAEDAEFAQWQARIDAMKDGAQKTLEARKLKHEQEMSQIRREGEDMKLAFVERAKSEFEANPNNLGKFSASAFMNTAGYKKYADDVDAQQKAKADSLNTTYYRAEELMKQLDTYQTSAQKKANELYRYEQDIVLIETLINEQKARGVDADSEMLTILSERLQMLKQMKVLTENESMWEYMASMDKYEEYAMRRQGVMAQRNAAIGQESDPWKRAQMQRELENELRKMDFSHFQESINWEQVFGNLGGMAESALNALRDKLSSLIANDKDMAPDAIKTLQDAIRNIDEELGTRSPFDRLSDSILSYIKAQNLLIRSTNEVSRAFGDELVSAYDEAVKAGDWNKVAQLEQTQAIVQVIDAEGNVTDKTMSYAEALKYLNDVSVKLTATQSKVSATIKGVGAKLTQMSQVGQSVVGIMQSLGIATDNAFGQGLERALGGLATAGDALESFDITKPGSLVNIKNYVNLVKGVIDGVAGVGQAVGSIFGLKGADYSSYNKLVEKYTTLQEIWDDLLAKKREYISMSYGIEAQKAGDEALALNERRLSSFRELLTKRLNSGASVGSHSIGVRIQNSMSGSDWSEIAKALGMSEADTQSMLNAEGRMQGLARLSSEQLLAIKENAYTWWATLDEDVRKYLEQIIDAADQAQQITEETKNQLTSTTFDNIRDGYLSMLRDMQSDTQTASDNISEMFFNALLSQKVWAQMKDRLRDWYDKYAQAMGDGELTSDEMNELRDEYMRLAKEGLSMRDQLAQVTGYEESQYNQEASRKGFQVMSEDQAEELSGRFTALQVAGEQIRVNSEQMLALETLMQQDVQSMRQAVVVQAQDISEIADIQRESVGLLTQIARNTNQLYTMNERLGRIEEYTRRI